MADGAEFSKLGSLSDEEKRSLKRTVKKGGCEILGEGGFSKVVLAKLFSGDTVAIKVHEKKPRESKNSFRSRVEQELFTMRKVEQHPHVLKTIDIIEGKCTVLHIMEFAEGGSLEDQMIETEGALNIDELECIFKTLVQTVRYLHSNNIVHRDLKPGNILFDASGTMKLSDFGSAGDTSNVLHMLTAFGVTTLWSAPEASWTSYRNTCPEKLDVYSLGVLYLLMFWGFDKMDRWLAEFPVSSGYPLTHPSVTDLPQKVRSIISPMLEMDPRRRCMLDSVVCTEWFEHIETCDDKSESSSHTHKHRLRSGS
ncbi:kinase-like domain-containing protein [Cladochytrium replicatum]|nr:kinase-like domain-containing protein [Cladochytrium replicatum]